MDDSEFQQRLENARHAAEQSLADFEESNRRAALALSSLTEAAVGLRTQSEQSFANTRSGLPNRRALETGFRRDLRRARRMLMWYRLKQSLRLRVASIKYAVVQSWRFCIAWLRMHFSGILFLIVVGGLAWLIVDFYVIES